MAQELLGFSLVRKSHFFGVMMKKAIAVGMACLGLQIGVAQAAIDFEADAAGDVANGFTSSGFAGVHFSDTVGANLDINDYGAQGLGKSLAINTDDDGSKLRIAFDFNVSYLSLMFGNDDPGWTTASDRAWLEIFKNGVSLTRISMEMNRDDIMNQTIDISGYDFDSAEFWYGNVDGSAFTGNGVGLIEIVDNINYRQGQTVPEPFSLALVGLGLAGLGLTRRRKA